MYQLAPLFGLLSRKILVIPFGLVFYDTMGIGSKNTRLFSNIELSMLLVLMKMSMYDLNNSFSFIKIQENEQDRKTSQKTV